MNSLDQTTPAYAVHLVRLALGINYFHFGFLKFYPDLSPAELSASYVAQRLAFYWIEPRTTLVIIAIMECAIGLSFLFGFLLRWMTPVFLFHMLATFLPLFLLPEYEFKFAPFAPTLEGQYILKNLVLVSAGWVVLAPHFMTFFSFGSKSLQPLPTNEAPSAPRTSQ